MLATCARRSGKGPLNGVIRNLDSARSFHFAIMTQENGVRNWRKKLAGLVTRNFDPGLVFVNAGFARKTKNLFAQNVAHDFAGATFNGVGA